MLTVVCALFDGGEHVPAASRCFSPEWVDKLYRGVRRNYTRELRFVCLTHYAPSMFTEPVEAVPFIDDNRKWTCLMEAFRPDIAQTRAVLLGLDTIILGSLDELFSYDLPLAMCKDRGAAVCKYNNAVTLYNRATASWLWDAWTEDPERWERECRVVGQPSEMAFINKMLASEGITPDLVEDRYPGQVVCYRGADEPALRAARAVWFYNRPKCNEVREPFLKAAWL